MRFFSPTWGSSGSSSRGWLLASDSLPCWRKARPKAMVRHRFRGLLPFCLCCGASRQKGRRDEIGSPSWLCAVAHHAAQPPRASHPTLYSLLCSLVNRLIAHASLRRRFMIERRFRHTSTRGSVAPRRTSNRRFIGDCIHYSLLRRGATEPPDSHSPPLHVLHVLHG